MKTAKYGVSLCTHTSKHGNDLLLVKVAADRSWAWHGLHSFYLQWLAEIDLLCFGSAFGKSKIFDATFETHIDGQTKLLYIFCKYNSEKWKIKMVPFSYIFLLLSKNKPQITYGKIIVKFKPELKYT